MNLKLTLLSFFTALLITSNIQAQDQTIKLWPDKIPGATGTNRSNTPVGAEGAGCIDGINDPELNVFLPKKGTANGTAVLICPGGGYRVVCVRKEGYDVAEWLAAQGVTAFVLQYRLPSDAGMKDKTIGPLQDAQRAMRLIRQNAATWNIDTARVGVMGFSAGGHLAATLSNHYNEKVYEQQKISARPAFSLLIYPVISFDEKITHMGSRVSLIGNSPSPEKVKHYSNELQVSKNTPPAFLVHATDDTVVPVQNSLRYYEALEKHKVPAELHIYQRGGHGFALGREGTEKAWPETCLNWLRAGGWL